MSFCLETASATRFPMTPNPLTPTLVADLGILMILSNGDRYGSLLALTGRIVHPETGFNTSLLLRKVSFQLNKYSEELRKVSEVWRLNFHG